MIYTEEKITIKLLDELEPLFKLNTRETGTDARFEINKLTYVKMAMVGAYVGISVRDMDGKCVGYAGYSVTDHLYHPDYRLGNQDTLYVHPDYRKGMVGVKLIKFSEKILKENYKVNLVIQHSTVRHDISRLLGRLGYNEADTTFIKEV